MPLNSASETSDFWWLSETQASQVWSVGFGHHAPLTDDDEPSLVTIDDREPVIPGWFHSLGGQNNLSRNFRLYAAHVLSSWSSACQNTNVYRTLRLYPKSSRNEPVVGPFLIDIDNQDWTNGYSENLEDARIVAVRTVELLTSRRDLAEGRDFRVFFSGRKGFNIEVCPTALGIKGSLHDQIRASADRLDEVIREVENGSSAPAGIDRIYGNRFG